MRALVTLGSGVPAFTNEAGDPKEWSRIFVVRLSAHEVNVNLIGGGVWKAVLEFHGHGRKSIHITYRFELRIFGYGNFVVKVVQDGSSWERCWIDRSDLDEEVRPAGPARFCIAAQQLIA